ncbi:YwqG family protein [Flavobacterium sp. SH_e]|uniref:YwqG family protein n=1 Tax=Flavobacterium sp. SH_e TaxID=2983767 RepID=UPI0021E4AF5A|nr:YwqG family protein [Flavobacterium sp. SH_e]MCV2484706.1 YwqG family protein [Flavobacterium sp. SH_e]
MKGKHIVRLMETIRIVSILLLLFWIYDFQINHGLGITKIFYYVIFAILVVMIGILVQLIFKNQTSIFETHKKNVNKERVRYISIILIFPLLAVFLYGTNYYSNFEAELLNFPEKSLYQDSQKENEIMEPQNFSIEDSSFLSVIEKYKRSTTLLQPHKSVHEISWKESKFGGYPNMESFSEYPKCDVCKSSLNFVFQLYRKDFPEFYFPRDTNIFQLFRCPNEDCKSTRTNDISDHKMFHYYSKVDCEKNRLFVKNKNSSSNIELEVPDCYLKPTKTFDYPYYDEYDSRDLAKLDANFRFKLGDNQIEKYVTKPHTKLDGYPSFIQNVVYPKCSCGRIKEFLFQLSSDDTDEELKYKNGAIHWSDHGIMIGDAGNIYYYICLHCGEKSIESYWDCS